MSPMDAPYSPGAAAAAAPADARSPMDRAIDRAVAAIHADQHEDGYWCYEFEADCTIPAEYILMMHFMDEVDEDLERKIAVYLREHQGEEGGWSLFPGGVADLSATVKAYFALKLAGDAPEAPHMFLRLHRDCSAPRGKGCSGHG